MAIGLALLTILIFMPVIGHTFVNYDDDLFVTNNVMVAPGFTWEGIKWAFTSADIDYWRPLSWLSHMLDMELFGPVGGLHHMSSLLIHVAAAVMLLLALHRLTRELWPSAAVAALFAWHPLHVESVAWIAERKDVLCGFFWFYTLWAYAGYVEQPSWRRYANVLFGFVLGAMSKPMIMTLPCVLLLLDFWPLRRRELYQLADWKKLGTRETLGNAWAVLGDKVPLFAVSLVLGLSTIASQHQVGTVSEVSLELRLQNALAAYGTYAVQTFWPADLCVLYRLRSSFPVWEWASALLLGISVTVASLVLARRYAFLIVGWLWFLGVLFPVLGVVRQVGEQGHADRYTYLPLVGVFIIVVWSLTRWVANCENRRRRLSWLLGLTLLLCAVQTRRQLVHWEDGITLFTQAVRVDPKNTTALNNLSAELIMTDKWESAIPYVEQSLKYKQNTGAAHWHMALCLLGRGEFDHAQSFTAEAFAAHFQSTSQNEVLATLRKCLAIARAKSERTPLKGKPNAINDVLLNNEVVVRKLLAIALATRKDFSGAIEELTKVIKLDPSDVKAQIDKSLYLAVSGNDSEAITQLRTAIAASPTNAIARSNLGALLAKRGEFLEAFPHYRAALAADQDNPDTRHNYAIALARSGQPSEARQQFDLVLRQSPNHQPALQQLAWLVTTNAQNRNLQLALSLAKASMTQKRTAPALDTLAAVLAATHDFDGAIAAATEALELARRSQQRQLEDSIHFRLQTYRRLQSVNK